jgi:exopolysaccharide biosynthesis polyprenyl glycosylphosphotransferase
MNATERAALLQGFELYDEMTATVDTRTLEILDRRRRTATVRRRGWLVRRMLLAADLFGLTLAVLLAEWVVNRHSNLGLLDARTEVVAFLASLPAWVVVAKVYGMYDQDEERTDHSTVDDFSGVFHMITVCTWLSWAISYLSGFAHPTAPKLIIFWAAAIAFVTTGRATARSLARRNVTYLQNTVIVGAGEVGQLIARKLLRHPEYGINVVGFIDSQPKERADDLQHLALLGGEARLPAIVRLFDVERVIIAFSNDSHQETLQLIRSLKDLDVQIEIVPRLFERMGPRVGIDTIEGIPLVAMSPLRLSASSLMLKRSLDLVVAIAALALLQPFLWLIALLIKLDTRGPVLHRDERVGLSGETFHAYKFRTMRPNAHELLEDLLRDPAAAAEFDRTHKLSSDPRVTRVGSFLRRTSLDELPQLLNILRGDVSLVGPRPITRYEYERYGNGNGNGNGIAALAGYWESNLRPGLTGYWQINGRSSMDYADRLRLDMAYVTSWSMRLDLAIVAKTLRALISGRGAA